VLEDRENFPALQIRIIGGDLVRDMPAVSKPWIISTG